jgi:hypothetical protein
MNIRPASIQDFDQLYELGKSAPELKVSASEDFMDPEEFRWSITDPHGVFLIAEEDNRIVGFTYASAEDLARPYLHKYACLVYMVVKLEFRRRGIADSICFR